MAAVSEAEERRRQAQLTAVRNQARQAGGRQGQKMGRQAGRAGGRAAGAAAGTAAGAGVGAAGGAVVGGIAGLAAGGVGAIPGAIKGAQTGGSQGARVGRGVGGAVGQQTGKMAGGFVGKKMGERAAEGATNERQKKAQLSQVQQASKLAKQVVTGKRDKSKSLVKQGLGEVGARSGQALGQAANFLLPGAGAVLAPIFKRAGRILGEHPGLALLAIAATSIALILVLLLPFLTMVIVINSVLSWF